MPASPGLRLNDRRVVVTGGARGIGAAIVDTFRAEGADVVVLDVQAPEVATRWIDVDLADPEASRAAATEAVQRLGGIDVLVNNAGILRMAPLLEISVDDWDLTMDVNARSMLVTTQVAARAMIGAGHGGSIVNMASMGGRVGSTGQAHYAASKAAVMALTRVSAMELGAYGIRVNCLCPGYVLTEMGAETRTPEMVAGWSSLSPLGRCAEPDDVARMALFLATDDSAYCTGQALDVSGGMVMP
ncbi:MAG: SDR family NAD(P)-dependent oxidoreductase [Ilumatobacteraceae bacterium]